MKKFWKALGLTALAAAVLPYRVEGDKDTGSLTVQALLWKLTEKPNADGGKDVTIKFLSFGKDEEDGLFTDDPEEAVLFADGDGEKIRVDLMDKCNLHTVLRLPTGIFYAQGVKTNVLFFTRGRTDKGNTQEVWFYDLRTNMPSFGKTNPLKLEHFADFEAAFEAADRRAVKDERWSVFTREQIAQKGNSLDLGLIRDDSVVDYADLPDPVESGEEAIAQLEEAVDLLQSVVNELKALSEVD